LDIQSGLLLPEESATVNLTIRIDKLTAQLINTAKEVLDDVIVLRLEKAKDIYLHVTAEYERSCYGVSLEELVSTLQPIRSTLIPSNYQTHAEVGDAAPSSEAKQSIPKELWRLVDALWSGGALKEKDLFTGTAIVQEVEAVREALDCGLDFPPCAPHAIVEALITLLEALPRPVIPFDLFPMSEVEASRLPLWSRRLLETLPPISYNVFVYFLSFLREVLAASEYNRSVYSLDAFVNDVRMFIDQVWMSCRKCV